MAHSRCVCIWWQCVPAQRSPGAGVCSAAPPAVRCAPRGPLELGRRCGAPASPLDARGRAHRKRRRDDGRHLVFGFHSETTVLLTCTPFHSPPPKPPTPSFLLSLASCLDSPSATSCSPRIVLFPPFYFLFHDSHENGTQKTIGGTRHTTTDPDLSVFVFLFFFLKKQERRKKKTKKTLAWDFCVLRFCLSMLFFWSKHLANSYIPSASHFTLLLFCFLLCFFFFHVSAA